jgi:hypothetical protein
MSQNWKTRLTKKISAFFNGKVFAVISLAVCLTTTVLVFHRVVNWDRYYAVYVESGDGSFPNDVGGLNFFAYFTEITVCVFTFFLTARAVYKLCGKVDGASIASNKSPDMDADGLLGNEKAAKSEPDTAYVLRVKIGGIEPSNSDKKTGKTSRFLSLIASKIKNLIENPDINCALATYAAVGFFVVSVGESCGVMTRYADGFFMLNIGNIWMHFVVFPLFAAAAVLREADKKAEVKKLPLYLVFPLIYFLFSMLRGAIIGWYPYPFLNPAEIYGMLCPDKPFDPAAAGLFIAVAALVFAAFIASSGFFVIKLYNKKIGARSSEKPQKTNILIK